MAVQAQDGSATQVPTVAVEGSGSNNVPSLGTPQVLTTPVPQTNTTGPGATVTPSGTLALPAVSNRICPLLVDYQAVAVVCSNLVTDESCIAQGTVNASPLVEDANFSFSKPGDRTRLTDLSELTLQSLNTESGAWTVVVSSLALKTNDPNLSASAAATLLLIGDVSIANAGEKFSLGASTAKVLGTLGINVRKSPTGSAAAVFQLSPGQEVLANGRLDNNEGRWIRIVIPNRFEGTGWVFGEYLKVTGDSDSLPRVKAEAAVVPTPSDQTGPEYGAMQSLSLLTGVTDASCTGTPDSGILLQTPNGIAAGSGAKLRVNGVEIVLNGTAFLQAQPNVSLRITVLEGEASITANGSTQQAQAISQVAVTMGQNLEPVGTPTTTQADPAKVKALPVDLLTRSFLIDGSTVAQVATEGPTGQQGSMTDTGDTAPVATEASIGGIASSAAQPTAAPPSGPCTLAAGTQIRNIRAAADINSAVVSELAAGKTITSQNVVRDAKFTTVYWYEVERGFMRFDTVEASPECIALVNAVIPASPTPQPTTAPTTQAATDQAVTVQTGATVAPTITPGGPSIVSSELGEVCGQPTGRTVSGAQKAGQVDLALGGTWTATAGSRLNVSVEGVANIRNDYGDIFRLVDISGAVLLNSKSNKELELSFPAAISFQIRVGANEGELIIVRAMCR